MSEVERAVSLQNAGLQALKDSGFIKDFDPSKTTYDDVNKTISFSYTNNAPIKRIKYSATFGFKFGSFKTRLPRKLKKKLKNEGCRKK